MLIRGPGDSREATEALSRLHDLGAGRVVCHPRPRGSAGTLGSDLLQALGKHPDAVALEQPGEALWALVEWWLRAERIEDLVLLRAHQLREGLTQRLHAAAAAVGARVWLVWHQPPRGTEVTSWAESGWRVCTAAAAVTVLASPDLASPVLANADRLALHDQTADNGPGDGEAGDDGVRGWPQVPHADFLVFRAVARRCLDPYAFARVDAAYRDTWRAARLDATRWRVYQLPTPAQPIRDHRARSSGDVLAAMLQRHLADADTGDEIVTRVRGVQAGFFREGLLLALALDPATRRARPLPDPVTRERLRLLCTPTAAAGLTLAILTGADAQTLVWLPASRVAVDGRAVELPAGGLYRIPDTAAGMVRAVLRTVPGARTGDHVEGAALLRDARGRGFSPGAMAQLLARAASIAGIDPPRAARGDRPTAWPFLPATLTAGARVLDLLGDRWCAEPGARG